MKRASVTIDVDCMHGHIDASEGGQGKLSRDERFIRLSYEVWLPRFLDILGELNIKATFFLVADFAKTSFCAHTVKRIIDEGHEVASHTLSHRVDLCMTDSSVKRKEIQDSKKILEDLSGQEVKGFRGPGYAVDKEILDILAESGYIYDSSVVPGYLFPLYKWFFWAFDKIRGRDPLLYPNFPPRKSAMPYLYKSVSGNDLVELPLNILPLFPIPFVSYIINNKKKFIRIFNWLKKTQVLLIYQFHDFEFLDCLQANEYFTTTATRKTCRKSLSERLELFSFVLSQINTDYIIESAAGIAESYLSGPSNSVLQ